MSTVQTLVENSIAIIKINRPDQLNSLSIQVLEDLKKRNKKVVASYERKCGNFTN